MFLLLTIAIFVLGGAGGPMADRLLPAFCVLPFVLLLTAKKWKAAITYVILYVAAYTTFSYFGPRTSGIVNFLFPISAKHDDGSLSCGNHYGE